MIGSDGRRAFFSTARVKLISSLAIVALVVGIVAEGVIIRKNKVETDVASATAFYADKLKAAEAEIAELKARTESEIARNAEELKLSEARRMTAEAEEKAQLAKKAAADAETAQQVAIYAAKQKSSEAEERAQLAKKAAADALTSQATAHYAEIQKAAEAEIARAKARSETANANVDEQLAGIITGKQPRTTPRVWTPPTSEMVWFRVKSKTLDFHDKPDIHSMIVWQVTNGKPLLKAGPCIHSNKEQWCKVDDSGFVGWAKLDGLELYKQQ